MDLFSKGKKDFLCFVMFVIKRTISFSGSEDFFRVLPDIWAVGVDVADPTT